MEDRFGGKSKTSQTLPGSLRTLVRLPIGWNWARVRAESLRIVQSPRPAVGLQSLLQDTKAHMRTVKKRSSKRTGSRTQPTMRGSTLANPPQDLASLVRGMYGRVARKLGVDPSYVSRVARGERQSEAVDAALRRSLSDIVHHADKQRGTKARAATRKTPRKG